MIPKSIYFFLFTFLFASIYSHAQIYSSTPAELTCEMSSDSSIKAVNENANMMLNFTTGDFVLKMDLSLTSCGLIRYDTIFSQLPKANIIFKANMGPNAFQLFSSNPTDSIYKLPGILTFNGKEHNSIAWFAPLITAQVGTVQFYKLNFFLKIDPEEIYIPGVSDYSNNPILVQIKGGQLNRLD